MNEHLKKKYENNLAIEQAKLELLEIYPDLEESSTRWDKGFLTSSKINKVTSEFDIEYRSSCGCCADAVMYAMPYIVYKDIHVYTQPLQIEIGEKNPSGSGIISCTDYTRRMILSEEINNEIDKFLSDNEPEFYCDEESDEDEEE